MKQLIIALTLALGVSAYGQTCPGTLTPTYGLCVPVHGTLNWDTWINPNWTKIDTAIAADVGGAFNVRGSVTSTNTVTVYVCGTGTPASLAYNVVVQ